MKIILLQRVLPTYRESLFEELRAQARQAGHSFELWVSPASGTFTMRATEGRSSWARQLGVISLPAWLGGLEYQVLPWREVLAADVVVVPDILRCVSNPLVLLLRRVRGKPVLVWGHGVNFQAGRLSRLVAAFRICLLRSANRHLVYTKASETALLEAGVARARIAVVENSIDATLAIGLNAQQPEVLAFREAHGLGDAPCVVFLGSWYMRKRPEVVVKVGLALRQRVPQARVLVIGSGDGLAGLVAQATQLPWLKLLGPLHGREKFVALTAARCLLVSAVAGLNVLDAMAVGLPVVLPQRADHSPEAVYVLDGTNGLVVADDVAQMALASARLIEDPALQARLSEGARQTFALHSISLVARNLLRYSEEASLAGVDARPGAGGPVVFVYQRMLPYHVDRFVAVAEALRLQGLDCVSIEVTGFDREYGAIDTSTFGAGKRHHSTVRLFPNADYLDLKPRAVAAAVFQALRQLAPGIVFAPAPAFAEGAGALHYKVRHGGRLVLMDDAWHATDHRGRLVRWIKKKLYGYMDGGFVPSQLHVPYFAALNIPQERQRIAIDVVGRSGDQDPAVAHDPDPEDRPYILFVGRLKARKGLDVLLRAVAATAPGWRLLVIGDGPEREALRALAAQLNLGDRVEWLGRRTNRYARQRMIRAQALLVPSKFEQWGLVVNEAWMAPTLVLGSDTVGALRATTTAETRWMMVPAGDVAAWQSALVRLQALTQDERDRLLDRNRNLAQTFELAEHVKSALALLTLSPRARPNAAVGWLARAWTGRVATW